jgi:hypothetical protein
MEARDKERRMLSTGTTFFEGKKSDQRSHTVVTHFVVGLAGDDVCERAVDWGFYPATCWGGVAGIISSVSTTKATVVVLAAEIRDSQCRTFRGKKTIDCFFIIDR